MSEIEARRRFLGLGAVAGSIAVGSIAVNRTAQAMPYALDCINVGYYAVGNGVADDTDAIQAAIDDAVDVVTGNIKAVYFPPLRYRVGLLSFNPNGHYYSDQQTRRRYGRGTSYIESVYDGALPAFLIRGQPGDYGYGPRFSNLYFGRTNDNGVNFRVLDIHRGSFENCTFFGGSVCLELESDEIGSWHNQFNHCVFLGPNWANNAIGVNIIGNGGGTGSNENWFTGCLFSGNDRSLTIGEASGCTFFQCEFSKAFTSAGAGTGTIELGVNAPETEFYGCRIEQNNAHPDSNLMLCSAPGLKLFGGRFFSTSVSSNNYLSNSAVGQYAIGCQNIADTLDGRQLPVANNVGGLASREVVCVASDNVTLTSATLVPNANLMSVIFNGHPIITIASAGRTGMIITIIAADFGELRDVAGNLRLANSETAFLEVTDTITLVCKDNKWYETARSSNR